MADEMEEFDDCFAFMPCKIPPSQVATLRNCPLGGEDGVFEDPDLDPPPRPPDSLRSQLVGILMASVSESQGTAEPEVDDLSVFHTPPEHHMNSNYSSSSDRYSDELCAQSARADELGNGKDGSKQDSGFEGGLGDEPGAKRIRVREKELTGARVPLGKTEKVVVDIVGADVVEIIDLDSGDDDEVAMVEVRSVDSVPETTGLMKQCAPVVDEKHESGRKCDEPTGDVRVDGRKRPHGSSESVDIVGKLDIRETEDEIVRLKSLVGNRAGKVAEISENEKGGKDGNPRGGLRNAGKRINDIDEFMFAGWDYVSRGCKDRKTCASDTAGRRRELPVSMKETADDWGRSMKEKEKNEEQLMKGQEKHQGGGNVVRKVVTGSGGPRTPKETSDSSSGVAGQPGTETIGVSKGKEKAVEGGSSVAEGGNVGAISGGLNCGNVEKDGGSNVDGKLDLDNGLMGMLEGLKRIIGNMDDEVEDSLEIAKKRGIITLPRPRWWDPEWSD